MTRPIEPPQTVRSRIPLLPPRNHALRRGGTDGWKRKAYGKWRMSDGTNGGMKRADGRRGKKSEDIMGWMTGFESHRTLRPINKIQHLARQIAEHSSKNYANLQPAATRIQDWNLVRLRISPPSRGVPHDESVRPPHSPQSQHKESQNRPPDEPRASIRRLHRERWTIPHNQRLSDPPRRSVHKTRKHSNLHTLERPDRPTYPPDVLRCTNFTQG